MIDAEVRDGTVSVISESGRVRTGALRCGAVIEVGGRAIRWIPERMTEEDGALIATGGPGGVRLRLEIAGIGGEVEITVSIRNDGHAAVSLARIIVFTTDSLVVGEDPSRWRILRNGFQSWSGTRTIGTHERDADVPTRLARVSVTDAAHPSPHDVGHVRSDTLTTVCDPVSGDALGLAFTTLHDHFGFIEIEAPRGAFRFMEAWADLDGIALAPGATRRSSVRLNAVCRRDAGAATGAGWEALVASTDAIAAGTAARVPDRQRGGWCSWYYYGAKVTESDVVENLELLADDGRNGPRFACDYVMVDDGHQAAIGDWCRTAPSFPSGMASLASRIRARGFDAGIWWAPFLVDPRSRTAAEHPNWMVQNRRGKPIIGILNPIWAMSRPMWVLDTTRDDVLEHLANTARTIGRDWGYAVQKLDFLYAASLPGVRHDPGATRVEAFRAGLGAIREGAGEDGFLLGCGCPLGPAVGIVDAMRIGADVTPYWSSPIDRIGGRGRHGLATRNAIWNILGRSVFDGRWWSNDPDCLMVRGTETRLSLEEVRTLATAIGMTDGMLVISDRLDSLEPARVAMIAMTRELTGGEVEVLDLFESAVPSVVVARHAEHTDVAVLNLSDERRHCLVDLRRHRISCADAPLRELWTGAALQVRGGMIDFGVLDAHTSRIARVPR